MIDSLVIADSDYEFLQRGKEVRTFSTSNQHFQDHLIDQIVAKRIENLNFTSLSEEQVLVGSVSAPPMKDCEFKSLVKVAVPEERNVKIRADIIHPSIARKNKSFSKKMPSGEYGFLLSCPTPGKHENDTLDVVIEIADESFTIWEQPASSIVLQDGRFFSEPTELTADFPIVLYAQSVFPIDGGGRFELVVSLVDETQDESTEN